MVLKAFAPPTELNSFQSSLLFSTDKIISLTYTKKFVGTGNFTLILPVKELFIEKLIENVLLNVDNDWFVVNNIKRDEKQIELSGTDLNGWLDLRITVFGKTQVSGAEGYDVVKGTTGECINHYMMNNAISPTDKNRKLPRLIIKQTAQGKKDDSYMARLQLLSEVVGNLCKNATIGYEISADVENNQFLFKTIVGTDRSVEQNNRPYVIFSPTYGNLLSATYERGNSDLLNAIYATGAGVTQTVYRNNNKAAGVLRRETAIDVSVSTIADIEDYTLNQVSGNIANNSYELDVSAINDFEVRYFLGDYVTVADPKTGKHWTAQIEETTLTKSAAETKRTLTIGDAKAKLLNKIQNNANLTINSNASKTQNVAEHLTDLITGNEGGYVFIHEDEKGQPFEILIMDNEDYRLAQNIWRWNKQGWGHSGNGYDGPYTIGATMDGAIVADLITAGTLKGIEIIAEKGKIAGWTIKGNTLVSNDGTFTIDSANNCITVNDANNIPLMKIGTDGIKYIRSGIEIGSIGITKGAESETYGITFNLKDGDAMTWSVYDKSQKVYVNKLRYTESEGLNVSNNFTCNQLFGHDVTDIDLGNGLHAWGYSE